MFVPAFIIQMLEEDIIVEGKKKSTELSKGTSDDTSQFFIVSRRLFNEDRRESSADSGVQSISSQI